MVESEGRTESQEADLIAVNTNTSPRDCLLLRRLFLNENVYAKEGGKEATGETPWSLAVHHQSLAATLRKTKRLRRRLPSKDFFSLLKLDLSWRFNQLFPWFSHVL